MTTAQQQTRPPRDREAAVAAAREVIQRQRSDYREKVDGIVAPLRASRDQISALEDMISDELHALPAHRLYGKRGRGAWLQRAASQLAPVEHDIGELIARVERAGEILSG